MSVNRPGPSGAKKVFAGPRIKRLRQSLSMTQAAMAEDLDISPSYLNLVERNQRPLTAQLLLRLGAAYDLDIRELSGDLEARLAGEMTEALADPIFGGSMPPPAEVMETAVTSPAMTQAFLTLYAAYRSLVDAEPVAGGRPVVEDERFPAEEVRDYLHARSNCVAELEEAAEALSGISRRDDLFGGLQTYLAEEHGVRVTVLPVHTMPDALRKYDRHSRRLFLSELLPPPSRVFQTAFQLGLLQYGDLIDRLAEEANMRTEEARRLCRIGLANYFAGALMMPYHPFLNAAAALRYDMAVLAGRFGASMEQVAHRLTTLQRQGARGVPFFLLRLDNAGNISKRFSAGGFHFARFGGTCPRWRIHDAFATPGQTVVQPVELPDGTVYLTISRTVDSTLAPFPQQPRKLAISLGCEITYASQLVYGDGLDLSNPTAVTPIGVTCRMCERPNCAARAFAPTTRPLSIDPERKNVSAFEFG